MKVDTANLRMWSKLGMRGTLGMIMMDLAQDINDLVVLSADLSITSGLDRFRKSYPDKFYNVGIAEQNMVGIAAGLAKEGCVVFATTFANFISMRAYEQVRLNLGYMRFPVKIVGLSSGFAMGMFGNTHYGMEDISLMRSIPNLVVVSPADTLEFAKSLWALAHDPRPAYLRLSGGANLPMVYNSDYDFSIGKAIQLKEGENVAIFATGIMVKKCLEAALILDGKGVRASVVNIPTIKPLDTDSVQRICDTHRFIFVVEEHSIVGGIGSSICEIACQGTVRPVVKRIGIPDQFFLPRTQSSMLEHLGLVASSMSDTILKTIGD